MATSAPSGSTVVEVDRVPRRRWRPPRPWPAAGRSTAARSRPSVPSASSLLEPSGSRTVTTPAMELPFLRVASTGGSRPSCRPDRRAPGRRTAGPLQANAEQVGSRPHAAGRRPPARRAGSSAPGVSRSSSSRSPHGVERPPSAASSTRRRPPAGEPVGRPHQIVVVPLPVVAVVVASRARRTAAGSHSFRRSPTKTRLPSDFDIFSPSRPTMPTCSQWRTKAGR